MAEPPEVGSRIEQDLDDTARFVNKLIKQCRGDVRRQWREVEKARRFRMGEIWEPADKSKLNTEGRPVPEINLAKRYLDVCSGLEIINRVQVHCLPRVQDQMERQLLAELGTGAYRATLDACMGDFEHTIAFSEMLAGGIACVGQRLDDTLSAGGEIIIENVDIMEMFWDTFDRTQNLERIRFCGRLKVAPKWVAVEQWPDEEEYILGAAHDGQLNPLEEPDVAEKPSPLRYDPANKDILSTRAPKDYVTVKEAFWFEDERWHEFIDPFSGQAKEMASDEFREFQKDFQQYYPETKIISVRHLRRVYKRAFVIKHKTMEVSNSPMQTGFPYKFITGDWDAREKCWRGLLYTLMDPQRFAAKYMSQTMHILAVGSKITTYYEDGAFENITQAKDEMSDFNPFIKLEENALSQQKFRVDPPAPLPEGMFAMWQSFTNLIREVTGINPDVLGTTSGEVPGVTTRKRLMQGLASVAWFFNAYRRFLLREAPGVIEYIREFYTDERLMRIGGEFDGQVIQLFKQDLEVPWDYILDDTPESPDIRAERWDGVKDIAITLFKTGGIAFVPSLIDDMPLRAKSRYEMKQYLQGLQQMLLQGAAGGGKEKGKEKSGPPPEMVQANVQKRMAEVALTMSKARAIDQEAALSRLKAQTEAFTGQAEHQRKQSEHMMGMAERRNALQRLAQAHRMDQLSQLSQTLKTLSGIGQPQAQV